MNEEKEDTQTLNEHRRRQMLVGRNGKFQWSMHTKKTKTPNARLDEIDQTQKKEKKRKT